MHLQHIYIGISTVIIICIVSSWVWNFVKVGYGPFYGMMQLRVSSLYGQYEMGRHCRFVGGLSAFHLYLSGTNQTTYEHFRHRHASADNPYDLGVLGNWGSVFCTRPPKRSELPQLAHAGSGTAQSTAIAYPLPTRNCHLHDI